MNEETKKELKNLFYEYAGKVALITLTKGYRKDDPIETKGIMIEEMQKQYKEFESKVEKLLMFKQ